MAKVIFEYDESTGSIVDSVGVTACALPNMKPFESDKGKNTVELVKLGMSADEIIKLNAPTGA